MGEWEFRLGRYDAVMGEVEYIVMVDEDRLKGKGNPTRPWMSVQKYNVVPSSLDILVG